MIKLAILIILVRVFQCRSSNATILQKCLSEPLNPILSVPKEFASNAESLTFEIRDVADEKWCSDGTPKTFQFRTAQTFEAQILPPRQNPTLPRGQAGWVNFTSSGGDNGGGDEGTSSYFLTNGTLKIGSEYFDPRSYCIKTNSGGEIKGDACVPNCSPGKDGRPCVKKCCKEGSMLNYLDHTCSESKSQPWIPEFYKSPYTRLGAEATRHLSPHYTFSPPSCGTLLDSDGVKEPAPFQFLTSLQLSGDEDQEPVAWRLLQDGTVWYNKANRGWAKLATENYCVDGMLNFGQGAEYRSLPSDQALVVCANDRQNGGEHYSTLYVTIMIVSSIFLLLTAIVYISLLDLQNVHGWTILSQVTSMFFMYVFLASAHIYGLKHTSDENGGVCAVIGVIAHFFFLSTFCWLTLINFDLCYTFRSLKPGGSGRTKGLKRYLCYFAFAIILPFSVITAGLTLEHFYRDDIESEVILPRYGVALCYVEVSAQGVYVYSIVGTLLACNVVLISITVFTIYKLKQSTKSIIKSSTAANQSYLLFVKLFIVMGVTWIFEIVSWADTNRRETDEIPWYWVIFDVINILQAIAIFVIFVCKRRILNQLKSKFPSITRGIQSVIALCCSSRKTKHQSDGEVEAQTAHTSLAQNSKESIETHM